MLRPRICYYSVSSLSSDYNMLCGCWFAKDHCKNFSNFPLF
jgi:hypothetical protein